MSIVITSNQVAKNNIGNIYGLKAKTDFSFFLDFNNDTYLYRDSEGLHSVGFKDAVEAQRSTKATYKNINGETLVAAINEPRLHYIKNKNIRGLLVEKASRNYLNNPYNPQTQTVSVPDLGPREAVVLSIEGTGSATMSGDVKSLTSASATQGNPQAAMGVNATSSNITVTTTGDVTKFQLEKATEGGSSIHQTTFIEQGLAYREAETVTLKPFLAAKMANAKTVVAQYVYRDRVMMLTDFNIEILKIADTTKPNGGIAVYYGETLSGGAVSSKQTVLTIPPNSAPSDRLADMLINNSGKVTTALTFDAGTLNLVVANDRFIKALPGAGTYTNLNQMVFKPSGGLLTRLAVYDYRLTDDELKEISTSWT